ncbi:hypothetical protein DSL72_008665 [Monilinia vaccinii-corymbosi]|uniref:Uncharacterized protein n=1 Tax=Monilinia vaccinii-corymbosi TaxID=61207 RepID=A0A8A3PPX3_9HELO|nr:hypothetical protein DSL72_008665 [Monilinia vaccinii-corymbosi]
MLSLEIFHGTRRRRDCLSDFDGGFELRGWVQVQDLQKLALLNNISSSNLTSPASTQIGVFSKASKSSMRVQTQHNPSQPITPAPEVYLNTIGSVPGEEPPPNTTRDVFDQEELMPHLSRLGDQASLVLSVGFLATFTTPVY